MPRTHLSKMKPDFTAFQGEVRAQMKRAGVNTRTAGPASCASYSRWIREPWRFTFGDLALFFKNLKMNEEEEKELVWELFLQAKKR